MKLCKEDRLVDMFKSMEGIFDIYCESKNMAHFLNLQGTLAPPTSNIGLYHPGTLRPTKIAKLLSNSN